MNRSYYCRNVNVFASFVRSSLTMALPKAIARDINLSQVFIMWIFKLYLLVNAVLYVGRIGDIFP